jgi:hypothetical protein
MTSGCASCSDERGYCVYPHYGVAPHFHDRDETQRITTVTLPRETWPAYFEEDPEMPGLGVYVRCPECGASS